MVLHAGGYLVVLHAGGYLEVLHEAEPPGSPWLRAGILGRSCTTPGAGQRNRITQPRTWRDRAVRPPRPPAGF